MTLDNIENYLNKMLLRPSRRDLALNSPPASEAVLRELNNKAETVLGVPLRQEYLSLVRLVDGGGYPMVFYQTQTITEEVLGREKTALGIIEQNLLLRQYEMADNDEIVYGKIDDCLVLPVEKGRWIGRHMSSRHIYLRFPSFLDLLKKAFE